MSAGKEALALRLSHVAACNGGKYFGAPLPEAAAKGRVGGQKEWGVWGVSPHMKNAACKESVSFPARRARHGASADRTQKHWDLQVGNEVTLEVKTATLGADGKIFRHENIEKDRNYDVLVLLDIAPDAIYLTAAPKHSLPFNERNDNWTLNRKRMHRRAHGIQYKWDLSLKDVARREIKSLDDVKRIMVMVLPKASPPAGENKK